MTRDFCTFAAVLALSACASPPPCQPGAVGEDRVYVVDSGWHTEIGVPATELDDDLAFYRRIFPGARTIMFGYGKKTFITAPPETFSEYLLGPVPGPAVIQVFGISADPPDAYDPADTVTLSLPAGGRRGLSNYIWNDLAKDNAGKPREVARGDDPASLFYAANSGYSLLHTCNTWVGDALQAGGLPVSGDGVILSGAVMAQSEHAAAGQCKQAP